MVSPYANIDATKWSTITKALVDEHPLRREEVVNLVLESWNYVIGTKLGHKYTIGSDIKLKPQIMGFFLHELIALELANKYPDKWRTEQTAKDKDAVYLPDEKFSIEIKTSSNQKHIYGNRSYAQPNASGTGKKGKSGYYLAINFEKFRDDSVARILLIRFGWLDHEDWMGQIAATGQQSRLSNETENGKLEILYSA
jgi:ScaI-like restriction endonuclease